MTEVFLCQIHSFWDRTRFGRFFQAWLFMTLWRVELFVWAVLPEECAHSNQSKSKSAPINMLHSAALHRTCSGRMSPKKCVFDCKGKITLFSFPKNPVLRNAVCSFLEATEFRKCVVYKKGPVRRWISTWFDTERWSGPSNKRSRSWFGTTGGK